MKEFTEKTEFFMQDSLSQEIFTESTLFFDIETTGFSARHNKIYFIGCACRKGHILTITQYFSENTQDEAEVLSAFSSLCARFNSAITFNGLGFDLPFIQERCRLLNVPEQLSAMNHIDIFKLISPLKMLFKLPNMKQKSLEQFLGLNRQDLFSGGELINVYHAYIQENDADKLALLQLHNKEDVLGMTALLPILAYREFWNGRFQIAGTEIVSLQSYEGCDSLELFFRLKPEFPLPKRISCGKDTIYLSGYGEMIKLKVRIYQGELKYFYSNYKDYYYLPQEDMAVHKSVAFYVDKDFRTRAKAATCYSRKSGRFLPQYQELFSPYFKLEYHDKISYIEMTEDFTSSPEFQKNYVMHLLSVLQK